MDQPERMEAPTVTMVLKSREATKSIKISLVNRAALTGAVITAVYLVIGLLDWVFPQYLGTSGSLSNAIIAFNGNITSGPTAPYPFTSFGWNVLGGTLYALPLLPVMLASLKFDLAFGLFVALVGSGIGLLVGLYAGFSAGYLDRALTKVSQLFIQIPMLALAIGIALILDKSLFGFAIAVIVVWWPYPAVIIKDKVKASRRKAFVTSSIVSGDSATTSIFKHVFPNVLSQFIIRMFMDIGILVEILATVNFLGLGFTSPYMPELGNMLAWGYQFAGTGDWWPLVIPGLFLVVLILGVSLLGIGANRAVRASRWRNDR